MIDDFLERVRSGLARLRQDDPKGALVFGAEDHGYRLHEPLGEGVVRAFEEEHGISLPPDYRAFITRAGNGGAGPFYGLFRLGEMDDGHDFATWSPGGFVVGNPRGAFPFRERWNLQPDEIEALLEAEDRDALFGIGSSSPARRQVISGTTPERITGAGCRSRTQAAGT